MLGSLRSRVPGVAHLRRWAERITMNAHDEDRITKLEILRRLLGAEAHAHAASAVAFYVGQKYRVPLEELQGVFRSVKAEAYQSLLSKIEASDPRLAALADERDIPGDSTNPGLSPTDS
jgi:hypothetical protein